MTRITTRSYMDENEMKTKTNINFVVEDYWYLKYLGCCTAAKYLYMGLKDICNVSWNSSKNNFDVVHFHTFGPKAYISKRMFNGKKVITAHSTPRLNKDNLLFSLKLSQLYKNLYKSFDHVIAVSNICKEELIDMGIKTDISVIANCINLKRFEFSTSKRRNFRKKYDIPDDMKVILSVAQQTPRKGIYDFIKIAKKCNDSNIIFVWVGDMPYSIFSKDYLKINEIKKKCGENILFLGFVNDIVEAYSGADLFFMPSFAEGMPIVILEAMSNGLDIVARDIPEFREVFGKNVSYFQNNEDADETMRKLLGKKSDSRKITEFVSKHDMSKIAEKHLKLYNSLI